MTIVQRQNTYQEIKTRLGKSQLRRNIIISKKQKYQVSAKKSGLWNHSAGANSCDWGDPPDHPAPPQSPGPEPPPPPAQPHHRTENQLAEIFLRFDSIFFVFTHVTQSVSHSQLYTIRCPTSLTSTAVLKFWLTNFPLKILASNFWLRGIGSQFWGQIFGIKTLAQNLSLKYFESSSLKQV